MANRLLANEDANGLRAHRLYWVAQRLGSGETFSCTLTLPGLSTMFFSDIWRLTRADFDAALSLLTRQGSRWARFHRPSDVVTVFHPGTARLLSYLAARW